jgi:hypothetical protein
VDLKLGGVSGACEVFGLSVVLTFLDRNLRCGRENWPVFMLEGATNIKGDRRTAGAGQPPGSGRGFQAWRAVPPRSWVGCGDSPAAA